MDFVKVGRRTYGVEYKPEGDFCYYQKEGKWEKLNPRGYKYASVRLAAQRAGFLPADDYVNGRKIFAAAQRPQGRELIFREPFEDGTFGRLKNYLINEKELYYRGLGVWRPFKKNNKLALLVRRKAIREKLLPPDPSVEERLLKLGWKPPAPLRITSLDGTLH